MEDFVHVSTGRAAPAWSDSPNQDYLDNSKAERAFTQGLMVDSLRHHHPKHHLSVTPEYAADLLAFAQISDEVTCLPHGDSTSAIKERIFRPPQRRYNDEDSGSFIERVHFASYDYVFKKHHFLLYVVRGSDGPYDMPTYNYVLSEDVTRAGAQLKVDELIKTVTKWNLELHDEVLVFDQGYWQPSNELWRNIQKAEWDDVILDKDRKDAVIEDVVGFFDAEERYAEFNVPWKRGVIFYGPPGNGKTISTKALMHDLSRRTNPTIESLYVKSLNSWMGPEQGIRQIFLKARQMAPCLLIFEDLDSMISPMVRSYFLNEVDGLESNHGILMIGSTNHLERLDPGIAKRPSRFDRKYFFDVPNLAERTQYAAYWRAKLDGNKKVDFPEEMCARVAEITDKFSFAYMKEAFVAALLVIVARKAVVGGGEKNRDPLGGNVLWEELKRQVENLRKEMDDEDDSESAKLNLGDVGRVLPVRMPGERRERGRWAAMRDAHRGF